MQASRSSHSLVTLDIRHNLFKNRHEMRAASVGSPVLPRDAPAEHQHSAGITSTGAREDGKGLYSSFLTGTDDGQKYGRKESIAGIYNIHLICSRFYWGTSYVSWNDRLFAILKTNIHKKLKHPDLVWADDALDKCWYTQIMSEKKKILEAIIYSHLAYWHCMYSVRATYTKCITGRHGVPGTESVCRQTSGAGGDEQDGGQHTPGQHLSHIHWCPRSLFTRWVALTLSSLVNMILLVYSTRHW